MRSPAQLDNQTSTVVSFLVQHARQMLPEPTASVLQNYPFPSCNAVLQVCFETWVKTTPKERRTGHDSPKYMHLHMYCRNSFFFRECSFKTKPYRASIGSYPNLGWSEPLGIFPSFTDSLSTNIALQLHKLTKLVHSLKNVSFPLNF